MGKHRSLEERLAHAKRQVERNAKALTRHEKSAERFRKAGRYEDATKACRLYEQAERLKRKWSREAGKLSRQIQTRDVLARRAPESGRGEEPELTPAQRRVAEREKREQEKRQETKRRRMAQAAVEWDPRTAHGKRSYDLVALGPALRANLTHMNACLKKKAERTDARVLAWSKFDTHCHRVHAGLMANPRYEPGVDSSTVPGVADSRLDAMKEDARIRGFLGQDMHGLLVEVVYLQRSFRDLQGLSYLMENEIAVMFRRALDLAAAWFRVGEDNSFGREANRILNRRAEL